ncbi:hypothetical protein O6P43_033159 [Quillaja saponaria]|uniref:Uncharacterized protein n=1 Tax=Quillaja saponaria TaxID=32244 RepID=A0AAD7KPG8_QUISA|nr:hypothetical protein O6P43_033159 [Quillaja saponaria]
MVLETEIDSSSLQGIPLYSGPSMLPLLLLSCCQEVFWFCWQEGIEVKQGQQLKYSRALSWLFSGVGSISSFDLLFWLPWNIPEGMQQPKVGSCSRKTQPRRRVCKAVALPLCGICYCLVPFDLRVNLN